VDEQQTSNDNLLFPILRGESVAEGGSIDGEVVIICKAADLNREWNSREIAVLDSALQEHLELNPGVVDELFGKVSAAICEFGEIMGELASFAVIRGAICIIRVDDATDVLENGMHIRVVAHESRGDIYFID
jgi:phosphohistidine swiveling domain-containing protein